MASRRRLGEFAQTYLQHYLRQKQLEKQAELQMEELRTRGEQNIDLELLQRILADPTGRIAQSALQSGRSRAGGLDVQSFLPRPEQAQATAAGKLGAFTKLEEVPGDIGIEAMVGAEPGGLEAKRDPRVIEDLMRLRNEREGRIAQASPFKVEGVVEPLSGEKQTRFVDPRQAMGQSFTTEVGPVQQGLDELTKQKFGELSPEMTGLKGAQQAGIEQATRPGAIARAGGIAGAQETAQIRAREKDLALLTKVEGALAQARAQGRPTERITSGVVTAIGQRMIELADTLNSSPDRMSARAGGAAQWFGNITGLELQGWQGQPAVSPTGQALRDANGKPMTLQDAFQELEAKRQGSTSIFLRLLGRVGTPTENDEKRTRQLLPSWGLTPTENANTNATFLKILSAADKIGSTLGQIDPSLPIDMQEAEFQRRLDMAVQEAQGQGMQGPAGGATFKIDLNGIIR